jgi:hypothetical protein
MMFSLFPNKRHRTLSFSGLAGENNIQILVAPA